MINVIKKASFQFEELDSHAQDKAFSQWLESRLYPWDNEAQATIDKFIDAVGHGLRRGHREGYALNTDGMEDQILELRGKRAMGFFWAQCRNEFWPLKKYWSKTTPNKKRTSRISREQEPHLAGYYIDMAICEPVFSLWTKAGYGYSVGDILEQCADSWESAYRKDWEYYHSYELFIQDCKEMDYLFSANGEML